MSKIRHYYFINKNGDPEIIRSDRKPRNAYPVPKDEITGKYEELDWVQLEDVDYDGTIVKEVRVNQALKDSILSQREADRIAKDQAEQDEANDILDLDQKVKAIKKNDIVDLKTIQRAIMILTRAVKKLNKRVLELEE